MKYLHEFEWLWGVLAGALLTFCMQIWIHRSQKNDEQRIASVIVASSLREWMSVGANMLYDMKTWRGSGGHAGRNHSRIPDFSFVRNPEIVTNLDSNLVIDVYELAHRVREANSAISYAIEYSDAGDPFEVEYEVAELTSCKIAQIYLEAEKIYSVLIDKLQWSAHAEMEEIANDMKDEVSGFEAKRAREQEQDAKFQEDFFRTTTKAKEGQ